MRNVLIFPDGREQDFQYPPNREVLVGEQLEITMLDDSVHILYIDRISPEDKRINYFLKY